MKYKQKPLFKENKMLKIDACGLACPQPILLLKKGIEKDNDIILLVDSKNALKTCSNYAQSCGFSVSVNENEGVYELVIKK